MAKMDYRINPFVYETHIMDPSLFVGRQRETRSLVHRLHNKESTSVVGEQGIGKTSLLVHALDPSTMQQLGVQSEQWIPVSVDLRPLQASGGVQDFWRLVFLELREQLVHRADDIGPIGLDLLHYLMKSDYPVNGMRRVIDALAGRKRSLVLILDDFDLLTGNKDFGSQFLNSLRSLAIHRDPMPIITCSRRVLSELFDYSIVCSSPFFNVFGTVRVGLLKREEAEALLRGVLQNNPIQFTSIEHARLLTLAGCHPNFLQIGRWLLFDAYRSYPDHEERLAIWKIRFSEEVLPFLGSYWARCTAEEKGLLCILAMLSKLADNDTNIDFVGIKNLLSPPKGTLHDLMIRGMVVQEGLVYVPFGAVFTDWILREAYQYETTDEVQTVRHVGREKRRTRQIKTKFLAYLKKDCGEFVGAWLGADEFAEDVLKLMASIEPEVVLARPRL